MNHQEARTRHGRGFGLARNGWAGPIERRAPLRLSSFAGRIVRVLKSAFLAKPKPDPQEPAALPFVDDELVARAISEWRARASYLPREFLADPAWGILLELLEAEIQGRRASLCSIRKASGVSASTADRWLRALEREGLVADVPDRLDSDRKIVRLSRKGSSAVRRYFHEVVESRRTPNPRRERTL